MEELEDALDRISNSSKFLSSVPCNDAQAFFESRLDLLLDVEGTPSSDVGGEENALDQFLNTSRSPSCADIDSALDRLSESQTDGEAIGTDDEQPIVAYDGHTMETLVPAALRSVDPVLQLARLSRCLDDDFMDEEN